MKFTPNENVLRVALIVFSIIFGILSISLVALGAVYIDELWWPKRYVGLDFVDLPILLIVLGSLSFVMALAGCLCAKTYNRTLLLVFGVILLTILCLELSIAVIAFINFDEHDGADTKTHRLMVKQYNSPNEEDKVFFREIEDHYNCCGVFGIEEYCAYNDTSDYYDTIYEDSSTPDPFYGVVGCAETVNGHIQVLASEIGYIATAFALLQVVEIGYVYLIRRVV